VVCAAALVLSGTAQAAEASCEIQAYLADPDTAGTNVRSTPSARSAVVARLPHVRPGEDGFTPEVTISGFSNGWAEIRQAIFADYGDGEQSLFAGRGWIWGGLLSATLNHVQLRAAPSEDARVVVRLSGADWGPDSALVTAIEDCRGPFVHVTARLPDGRVVKGWTDGACGNQATTCP
jgi:hypothetical protein